MHSYPAGCRNGLFNSVIVAACSADAVTTYFSTYDGICNPCIQFQVEECYVHLHPDDHDDSYTGNCTWIFTSLVDGYGIWMDSFIPLIIPAIAAPVVFFYMKQYMESALPLSVW